jgi:hypothetical protein
MDLRLGCPGSNSSPRVEVGEVLGRNDIQELSSGGHTHLGDLEKQVSGNLETSVDVVRTVHVGVWASAETFQSAGVPLHTIDKSLPSHSCSWSDVSFGSHRKRVSLSLLLEVDPHDDQEVLLGLLGVGQQLRVMDGAWSACQLQSQTLGLTSSPDNH